MQPLCFSFSVSILCILLLKFNCGINKTRNCIVLVFFCCCCNHKRWNANISIYEGGKLAINSNNQVSDKVSRACWVAVLPEYLQSRKIDFTQVFGTDSVIHAAFCCYCCCCSLHYPTIVAMLCVGVGNALPFSWSVRLARLDNSCKLRTAAGICAIWPFLLRHWCLLQCIHFCTLLFFFCFAYSF